MSVLVVSTQMAVIFIMLMVGYGLAKRSRLSPGTCGELSFLIANVTNPALLLSGALSRSGGVTAGSLWAMAGLSLILDAVLILLACVMGPLIRADRGEWDFYNLLTAFGNTGMIGIPVAAAVLGSGSLPYMAVFNVLYMLIMYTYAPYLLDRAEAARRGYGRGKAHVIGRLKGAANPGSVMAALSIAAFAMDLHLPPVLEQALAYMGDTTCFLSILLIGASMATAPLKEMFCDGRMYVFSVLRLLALPVAASYGLRLVVGDRMLVDVCTFILSVPCANMPAIMAMQRGIESALLTRGIILTTLLSLLTITAVSALI